MGNPEDYASCRARIKEVDMLIQPQELIIYATTHGWSLSPIPFHPLFLSRVWIVLKTTVPLVSRVSPQCHDIVRFGYRLCFRFYPKYLIPMEIIVLPLILCLADPHKHNRPHRIEMVWRLMICNWSFYLFLCFPHSLPFSRVWDE